MSQITVPSTSKPQRSININFDVNIVINGVTNMIESDEKQIICNLGETHFQASSYAPYVTEIKLCGVCLYLFLKLSLIITGQKLTIASLDTEKCLCTVTGSIESLKYVKGKQKQSLLKRF